MRVATLLTLGLLLASAPLGRAATPSDRCAEQDVPAAAARVKAALDACADSNPQPTGVPAAAPACAGGLVTAAKALAAPFCAHADDLTPDERRCQEAIARAAGDFVSGRLQEIAGGRRATGLSRVMEAIVPACGDIRVRTNATGTRVPAMGTPCADAGGTDGARFDAATAGRCIRAALSGLANRAAPKALPPNFVVVLSDDQRWDTMPYMPRLTEEVVNRGIVYRNAFVNTPICGPSRAAFLSGRYAFANGVRSNDRAADSFAEETSIARRLHGAGYRTGLYGIYLADLGEKIPPGWDEWYALRRSEQREDGAFPASHFQNGAQEEVLPATEFDELTDRLREKSAAFLDQNRDEPFLLWLGMRQPHAPAIPAERHAEELADIEPWRPPSFREEDVTDKPSWVRFMKAISKPEGIARVDALRLAQLRSVLAIDDAVGQLSDRLEELGLTDDTVFVFASDNGHLWGEHWLASKFAPYEESIRVPFVLRYPRLAPTASEVDDLVLNVDLAWTLADLADLPPAKPGVGRSLLPTFEGRALGREEIVIETPGGLIARPSLALRTDRWKYIRTDADAGITEELYDLEADPYEIENLATAPEHAERKKRLSARLDERLRALGHTPPALGETRADRDLGPDSNRSGRHGTEP